MKTYQEVNEIFWKPLVFHLGHSAGFYSEFNNMVIGMLFCLKNELRFQMYSKDAFFFDGEGWQKYFRPFCEEKYGNFHHKYNTRGGIPNLAGRKKRFYNFVDDLRIAWYRFTTGSLLTQDIFVTMRNRGAEKLTYSIPDLNIIGDDTRTASGKLIDMIYKFNDRYQKIIDEKIAELNLPEHYIGMHVRGGDKIIEYDVYSFEEYIKIAENVTTCRNAFILTDDYSLYESLVAAYPEWTFYTLTFKDERGYLHADFQSKTDERREAEMLKVFESVEIIRKSDHFIGTYSSNVGMFLGMSMPVEKVTCLDSDTWYIA